MGADDAGAVVSVAAEFRDIRSCDWWVEVRAGLRRVVNRGEERGMRKRVHNFCEAIWYV